MQLKHLGWAILLGVAITFVGNLGDKITDLQDWHGLTTTQTIGSLLVDLSKLGAAAFGGWMTAKKSADA